MCPRCGPLSPSRRQAGSRIRWCGCWLRSFLKHISQPVYLPLWARMPRDTGHEDPLLPSEVDLPPPGPPRSGRGKAELWFSSKVEELAR